MLINNKYSFIYYSDLHIDLTNKLQLSLFTILDEFGTRITHISILHPIKIIYFKKGNKI